MLAGRALIRRVRSKNDLSDLPRHRKRLECDGVTNNLELTVVDFVSGREDQTVTFVSGQSPFPTSLARHLTTVAAGRL
jgi:hypothetical protein